MLRFRGSPALSPFRLEKLLTVVQRQVAVVTDLYAEYVHFVDGSLNDHERAVLERLEPFGAEVRLATVYWKPNQNQTDIRPDFYVRETDAWIVFPHEMDGLTPDEVRVKDPVLYDLLSPQATPR